MNGVIAMNTCMIKNCKIEAEEEGLCAQHYTEIIKKVVPELADKKKTTADDEVQTEPKDRVEKEDLSAKTKFMIHSLLAHVEKITDSAVTSFNNLFSLSKEQSADIYRHVGSKFINKSKSQSAIPYLKKVVELNPEDADAQFKLGSAYYLKGSYDDAISCFEGSLKIDPENYECLYALGKTYGYKELYDKAIAALKKAEGIKPDNPNLHYRLGANYDSLEKYKEAIGSFKKAIELDPQNADYYQSLGFTYESMDQHKEAVNCYKKAISLKQSVK